VLPRIKHHWKTRPHNPGVLTLRDKNGERAGSNPELTTEARQMGDDLLNEGCRYLNDTEV
jgi:hypothetical protein